MSEIDEIKARLDTVELISEYINLRRSGKNYVGFCPFHSNTRTPAFYIFPESGTWHCFGCHEGGDIFSFIMKKEGLDFKDALQRLAIRAGVDLKPRTAEDSQQEEKYQAMHGLLEEAVTFYQHNLRNTPAGKPVLEYLTKRGLNDDSIQRFGLGYAPAGWEVISQYFLTKGYSQADLLSVGLVSARESGGVYDRFRHRLMFPIRNERGLMTGFGARSIEAEDMPKYLNSPQTPIFDKSRLLYGMDLARKLIRMQDQVVIVEGYMDVIALHQHGFSNVVSAMGTAINEHQLRMLNRLTKRLVLALDPDTAGSRATLRGLEIARQTLERTDEVIFDAQGLLRHEARLQSDIRVASLPDGLDPDEVVNEDPASWTQIIEHAKPIVAHVMDVLVQDQDIDDPKVKNKIARQVLQLIEDLPSSIERETYRQRLARLLRVDERAMQGMQNLLQRKTRPSATKRRSSQPGAENDTHMILPYSSNRELEAHILGVLLREPGLLFFIDRSLQEDKLERFSDADFQSADFKEIYSFLRLSLEQDEVEPYKFIQNKLSSPLMEVADDLYNRTDRIDPGQAHVLEDLLRTIIRLRREHFGKQKMIIDTQISEAQEQNAQETLQTLLPMLHQYVKTIALYDHAWSRYIRYN